MLDIIKSGLSMRNDTLPAEEYVRRVVGSDHEEDGIARKVRKFYKSKDRTSSRFNRVRSKHRVSSALDLSILEGGLDVNARPRAKTPG